MSALVTLGGTCPLQQPANRAFAYRARLDYVAYSSVGSSEYASFLGLGGALGLMIQGRSELWSSEATALLQRCADVVIELPDDSRVDSEAVKVRLDLAAGA